MKLLVVQTSFLGDSLLSTPVLATLSRLNPGASITVLCRPDAREIFEGNPNVDQVLIFEKRGRHRGLFGLYRMARELRARRFERAYALQRSARTAILLKLAGIPERIGFADAALSFLYHESRVRPKERHEVIRALSILAPELSLFEWERLEREGDRSGATGELGVLSLPRDEVMHPALSDLSPHDRVAVLSPGSAWKTKMWFWQGYRKTGQELLAAGWKVFVAGAPGERELCEQVVEGLAVPNLAGRTTLRELFSIVQRADCVVCNDSFVLHVASALKRPIVAIFCSTSPSFGFGPWRTEARVLGRSDLFCRPCGRHGFRHCPQGTEACMKGIPPEQVLRAVRELTLSDEARAVKVEAPEVVQNG